MSSTLNLDCCGLLHTCYCQLEITKAMTKASNHMVLGKFPLVMDYFNVNFR